ncbi:MAG TPA: DUF1598 domain-containing protein [Pirellulales bacterium]|jgi:hypothetical protein|nr:DUF1598 domain-containing protein [Pirellulales bacterium]
MRQSFQNLAALLVVFSTVSLDSSAFGQVLQQQQQAVGGVSINAEGVLKNLTVADRKELRELRAKAIKQPAADLQQPSKLRFVSLAKLDAAIQECAAKKQPLPDEIQFLAGLQRIEYVFIDTDHHDIILAGPGEGWKINQDGNIVGATSNLPVMHLDDLVTAIRTANAARQGGINCSIDPTAAGINRVKGILAHTHEIGNNPQATINSIEEALGGQVVTVSGVPTTSRFARVLVAADYRMKRLGMKFDESPVTGLPSYLDLSAAGPVGLANAFPRWWMVPNYDAVIRDPDGLAWQFHGTVKCMAAEDYFNGTNKKQQTVKATGPAQKWADNMTKKYDELSVKEPIFAELRSCMDLAIVGTLLLKENLLNKAGVKLPALTDPQVYTTEPLAATKTISSQATFVKKGSNWLISVSGGVQIQPWEIVQNVKSDEKLTTVRQEIPASKANQWWWD